MILANKKGLEEAQNFTFSKQSYIYSDWRILSLLKRKKTYDGLIHEVTSVGEIPSSNKRILFFDIESATGNVGGICEFGYVLTNEKFEILEERNILINPKCEFSWRVLKKVLKRDKRVYEVQKGLTSHYDFIRKLITGADLVFGFATINDVNYLNSDLQRFNLKPIDYNFYDIQKILGEFNSDYKNLSLENSMNLLEVKRLGKLHDARYDALNSMLILKKISEALKLSVTEIVDLTQRLMDKCYDGEIESLKLRKIKRQEQNQRKDKKRLSKLELENLKRYIDEKNSQAFDNYHFDNILSGKKICFSRKLESSHTKCVYNLIHKLSSIGAFYEMKSSETDIFITDGSNDVRFQGIRCAEKSGKNIKMISFDELLEILEMDFNDLIKLDYPHDYNKIINPEIYVKSYIGSLLKGFYKEDSTCLILD